MIEQSLSAQSARWTRLDPAAGAGAEGAEKNGETEALKSVKRSSGALDSRLKMKTPQPGVNYKHGGGTYPDQKL